MSVILRGVSKRYGARVVLDGCDLQVESGTIALLAGPNGAGKSTLLRCIAGLSRYEGDITVLGRSPKHARPGSLAYLPQSIDLPHAATVTEVLALFRTDPGAIPEGWLPSRRRAYLGELSGGEVQRVALAALLASAPRVILLDEPTADLDRGARAALGEWLTRLRADGASVIVTAPAPQRDEIVRLADVSIELEAGRTAAAPSVWAVA